MLAAAKVDNLDYESTVVAENYDRSFIHRDLFRIPRGQTSSLQVRVQKLEDVNVLFPANTLSHHYGCAKIFECRERAVTTFELWSTHRTHRCVTGLSSIGSGGKFFRVPMKPRRDLKSQQTTEQERKTKLVFHS